MTQTNDRLVLGIDGGGSKILALLATADGSILGRGSAGSCNLQTMPESAARATLRQAVEAAFADAGLTWRTAEVAGLGLAGLYRPADHAHVQQWVQEEGIAQKAVTCNDSALLLWSGALQGWGIGVIAGTGSIAFGKNRSGESARAGGWGYRFGDEGSGFAIGTEALRAITKAADGRGPQTVLTGLVLEHWGLPDPSHLIPHIYGSNLPHPEIARLAPLVDKATEEGDIVATRILYQAADELAQALTTVFHRLGFEGKTPAALGGGVLLNMEPVRCQLLQQVKTQNIRLYPLELVAEPAQGAVRFALDALEKS